MAGEFAETTLGRLMSFANGRSSPERADGLQYPVYGSNGVIGWAAEANADAGSIVIGRVGSYCGSLYFSKQRCWVTDNAIRATALDGNDSRFLFYLLSTLGLNNWRAGSGQPLLNQDILSRIPAAVPEPIEQRAIAHILGTLDDKIELNRRMSETLEAMARALFKSWFVDFLPVRAKMAAKERDPSLLLPQAEPNTWYVYAIECNDGSLYIGQTEDLRQRWLQHVGGKGASWTKQHPPVQVPYWEKQPSREAAVERENWLKTGYGRKRLKHEIAARTQTGDPVRAKAEDRDPGLPQPLVDLFPDSFEDSELGEIPKGWRVVSVYEVADVIYGVPFSSAQFNTEGVGEPLLRIRDLPSESPGVWTTEVHPKGYKVRPGDIVVGMDGEFRAYLWGGVEAWLNQRVCVFKPKPHSSAAFVRNAIIQPLADVEATETATTVIHLGKADIDQFRVVLPTPDVAGHFNTVCQRWYNRIVTSKQQSRTLAALRDALLPKLISGELRVKDAERFLEKASS
jgi:restriction endonuclease S subunit